MGIDVQELQRRHGARARRAPGQKASVAIDYDFTDVFKGLDAIADAAGQHVGQGAAAAHQVDGGQVLCAGAEVEQAQRVTHTDYPVELWQKVASPVWMDINPSDTLQYQSAREHDDERHICPLQLEVIRRGVELWTNPGEVVLSPFAGIGSEGHVSLQLGRKFIGIELKESYYRQAARNLQDALRINGDLFAEA